MPIPAKTSAAIAQLAHSASTLVSLGYSRKVVNQLRDLSAVVTFRHGPGRKRPPLIGFIGCTGTGKSTLFNALCGRSVSATGWRAHNTRGPVLFAPEILLNQVEAWEQTHGRLLMPLLDRPTVADQNGNGATVGAPGVLHRVRQTDAEQKAGTGESFFLIDLPDINSAPAVDERLVALDILPWLDVVIFMVDDETVYHRVFDKPVDISNEYGQTRFCVMVNRGRDRIDPNHEDWRRAKAFFGVDEIHILPDLNLTNGYDDDPAFGDLKKRLAALEAKTDELPLLNKIGQLAQSLGRENTQRQAAIDKLEGVIVQQAKDLLATAAPLPMNRIMPDETLHVLGHLGLKRFALSNLLYFFKHAATTGKLRKSFKLSFGDHRDNGLTDLLRIDRDKLINEVSARLNQYSQRLVSNVRRSPELAFFRQVAPDAAFPKNGLSESPSKGNDQLSYAGELNALADEFENQYRELLGSDSVAKILTNDPLATLLLTAGLAADVFALPGFGSWLLIPTAVKYLPLGKFENAKKEFQRAVQALIRKQLLLTAGSIRNLRRQIVLDDSHPLRLALETCSRHTGRKSGTP